MKKLIFISIISTTIYANYPELLFNGNCITCHSTNQLNKSAPTIMEIKKEYLNAFPNKIDFINYMTTWVLSPKETTSIMSNAVKKYKLMPELAYDKETLEEISSYIYENDFKKTK